MADEHAKYPIVGTYDAGVYPGLDTSVRLAPAPDAPGVFIASYNFGDIEGQMIIGKHPETIEQYSNMLRELSGTASAPAGVSDGDCGQPGEYRVLNTLCRSKGGMDDSFTAWGSMVMQEHEEGWAYNWEIGPVPHFYRHWVNLSPPGPTGLHMHIFGSQKQSSEVPCISMEDFASRWKHWFQD